MASGGWGAAGCIHLSMAVQKISPKHGGLRQQTSSQSLCSRNLGAAQPGSLARVAHAIAIRASPSGHQPGLWSHVKVCLGAGSRPSSLTRLSVSPVPAGVSQRQAAHVAVGSQASKRTREGDTTQDTSHRFFGIDSEGTSEHFCCKFCLLASSH